VHVLDHLVVSQFATGSAGALEAQAAAASLNARCGPPAELRSWRKAHGLTLKSLASALGVTWLTVQRWETGARGIPPFLYLALERLEQKAASDA
jgi:DNA-binding transcriptional regulator YiaG